MGRDADVFIVGGGPAGIAAAIAASERGFRVTVAVGGRPPILKACGEGLLPEAVAALGELGVELRKDDGCALRGIRFEDGDAKVSARFPGGHGIGVRREVLHRRMLERAADCGVTLLWNTPVTGLCEGGVVAGGEKIRARWIVGADGSRSRVRRWAGLEICRGQKNRFAFRRHYRMEPWTDFTEVYWGDFAQAYITPVSSQEICVVLIAETPELRFDENLLGFPRLASRLSCGSQSSGERGAVTGMFELARVYKGRVALIGDASGSVDAITGEGLSLSFRQASAIADALAAGDLEGYQQSHRRLIRRPQIMGNLLLLLGRRSGIRNRVMSTFEGAPQLFESMLAYHVGKLCARQIATAGAHFGWRFLTA
jgi:flavin-dependent dehydrogenase